MYWTVLEIATNNTIAVTTTVSIYKLVNTGDGAKGRHLLVGSIGIPLKNQVVVGGGCDSTKHSIRESSPYTRICWESAVIISPTGKKSSI